MRSVPALLLLLAAVCVALVAHTVSAVDVNRHRHMTHRANRVGQKPAPPAEPAREGEFNADENKGMKKEEEKEVAREEQRIEAPQDTPFAKMSQLLIANELSLALAYYGAFKGDQARAHLVCDSEVTMLRHAAKSGAFVLDVIRRDIERMPQGHAWTFVDVDDSGTCWNSLTAYHQDLFAAMMPKSVFDEIEDDSKFKLDSLMGEAGNVEHQAKSREILLKLCDTIWNFIKTTPLPNDMLHVVHGLAQYLQSRPDFMADAKLPMHRMLTHFLFLRFINSNFLPYKYEAAKTADLERIYILLAKVFDHFAQMTDIPADDALSFVSPFVQGKRVALIEYLDGLIATPPAAEEPFPVDEKDQDSALQTLTQLGLEKGMAGLASQRPVPPVGPVGGEPAPVEGATGGGDVAPPPPGEVVPGGDVPDAGATGGEAPPVPVPGEVAPPPPPAPTAFAEVSARRWKRMKLMQQEQRRNRLSSLLETDERQRRRRRQEPAPTPPTEPIATEPAGGDGGAEEPRNGAAPGGAETDSAFAGLAAIWQEATELYKLSYITVEGTILRKRVGHLQHMKSRLMGVKAHEIVYYGAESMATENWKEVDLLGLNPALIENTITGRIELMKHMVLRWGAGVDAATPSHFCFEIELPAPPDQISATPRIDHFCGPQSAASDVFCGVAKNLGQLQSFPVCLANSGTEDLIRRPTEEPPTEPPTLPEPTNNAV